MPEWVAPDTNPTASAESWADAVGITAEYARNRNLESMLAGMECPEPDELVEAARQAVAKMLAEIVIKDPTTLSKIEAVNPNVLVHFICVGAMAGAVYAVSNMQGAELKLDEGDSTNENQE